MWFLIPALMAGEYLALYRLVARVKGEWRDYGTDLLADARRRIAIMALTVPSGIAGDILGYVCPHLCWGMMAGLHILIALVVLFSFLAEIYLPMWQLLTWALIPQPYLMVAGTVFFLVPAAPVLVRRIAFALLLFYALVRCTNVRFPSSATKMDVILRAWWRYPWILVVVLSAVGVSLARFLPVTVGLAAAVGLVTVYQEVETAGILKKRGWM